MPIFNMQMAGEAQLPDGTTVSVPPSHALVQGGPRMQVTVSLHNTFAEQLIERGDPVPPPMDGLMLIDTGASVTCVDRTAAIRMGLPVLDTVRMTSASHAASEQNIHPINVAITGSPIVIGVPNAMSAELAAQGLLILLGRDALSGCTLHYNGPLGGFTLSL